MANTTAVGFTCRKLLGEVITDEDYGLEVSLEHHNYSGYDYFMIKRCIQGIPDKSITIPIQYAYEIGELLKQAHFHYINDKTVKDNGKSPNRIENYMR